MRTLRSSKYRLLNDDEVFGSVLSADEDEYGQDDKLEQPSDDDEYEDEEDEEYEDYEDDDTLP